MADWWKSLGLISQIFYCIAIPSTLVSLIQTIMLLVGMGQDADFSADGDLPDVGDVEIDDAIDGVFGDNDISETPDSFGFEGLRIITVRGIIAFLVVFGWVGIVLTKAYPLHCHEALTPRERTALSAKYWKAFFSFPQLSLQTYLRRSLRQMQPMRDRRYLFRLSLSYQRISDIARYRR